MLATAETGGGGAAAAEGERRRARNWPRRRRRQPRFLWRSQPGPARAGQPPPELRHQPRRAPPVPSPPHPLALALPKLRPW